MAVPVWICTCACTCVCQRQTRCILVQHIMEMTERPTRVTYEIINRISLRNFDLSTICLVLVRETEMLEATELQGSTETDRTADSPPARERGHEKAPGPVDAWL